jgi:hypothetical protein
MDPVTAAAPIIDLSGVDFTVMVSTITGFVPAVLGALVPIIAIRKGISFLMGAIRGA